MNNLLDSIFRISATMVEDEEKGIITQEDIFRHFTKMSYLDYCLMLNTRIYETFEYDNSENIDTLRRKLNRRDDVEQKIILIKAEKEKIIQYLESEEISDEIAISNKPIAEFFELMKGKFDQAQNDPDMRDMFDDDEGKELKIKTDIFIENADRFLSVSSIEDVELSELFINQPQLLTLSSPDEILQELNKQKFDDISQLIPSNFSKFGEVKRLDFQEIMDDSFKILYIHSQEQYFEMLRAEEKRLQEEYGLGKDKNIPETEQVLDITMSETDILELKTITIKLPNFSKSNLRKRNDSFTCLSRESTALLIDTLREVKVFFDEEYVTNENTAKAVQVLTGFSFNRLRTDLTAIPSKEDLLATQQILQKSIDLIIKQLKKR